MYYSEVPEMSKVGKIAMLLPIPENILYFQSESRICQKTTYPG